ncbi:ATP-binding protein [Sporolactobacillus terrae]|uniref:histidine kinase n=1 Tax=Sporolactobacillus terrae TaxID=269673 RepID=A0ABX5QAZ2_9BACL|nr:ATP-binding protein [Sporolactobacillus terrae]QAA23756.1 histidine kinase [Sporolactobacillus terrae]QAA26727.1 histidine kinase [Sporolactobacillus terrae]
MRRSFALGVVLLCYVGFFLIFLSWYHSSKYDGPIATHGTLDISHWNFAKDGEIQLNGQWMLYPGQILSPKDNLAKKKYQFMTVPTAKNGTENFKAVGSNTGTYRLLIHSDRNQVFGLQTSTIYSSNRIYVNGQFVGESGHPSTDHHMETSLRSYAAYFTLHKGDNELLIQTTRATGAVGWGISRPILFGTQQQISQKHDFILFNDLSVVISFFIIGLYFLGFFIQRTKDLYLLFFSIICLLFAVIISFISEARVIYLLFPNLSYAHLVIIESTSTLLIGIALLLYLYFAYPQLVSKKITYGVVTVSLCTLILDFLPLDQLTMIGLLLHTSSAVFTLAYAFYIFVLAIIQRVEGSVYLMIAALSMSIFVIMTTINVYIPKRLFALYSVSSLLFLLMLALLMSQRFSNAFKRSEHLTAELDQNNQIKDEFIAKISHEFRTPLNGIINIAQTLLASKKDRKISEEAEKLQMVTRIGYRLSDLVNDILDIEKLKHGTLAVRPVPLDVAAVVQAELAFYKLLAEKKGLYLVNQIPTDLPLIYADENRFRQIINNLVDNAIKYTQSGKITIRAKRNTDGVELIIADTGSGIPPSEMETIFHPFERKKVTQVEGTGLGLSIVKQLVALQKGKLWVDSEVGVGSIFHVVLPIIRSEHIIDSRLSTKHARHTHQSKGQIPAAKALITPHYSHSVKAPAILVVDDDLENLSILIDMLEGIPYNVTAVKNGKEALAELARAKPDLVITDLMMPGMSGFELCTKIRKQHRLTELPVLTLTAAINNEDKHLAFRAGANDILQKPYNFSEFAARIRGLILMKQAAAQATNMEVAFLQSQIRPHFLYNVLNSMIALSYEDIEKTRDMITQFAAYLRGSFDFQNTSSISSLKKELELVKAYLAIEKMRFGERVRVMLNVDGTLDFPLPPLMIQPLVENAVQHGIGKRKTGGQVRVTVRHEKNHYIIQVADNGVGMSQEELESVLDIANGRRSVGLKNINNRLKHFFGTELMIESRLGSGTTITMHLPDRS